MVCADTGKASARRTVAIMLRVIGIIPRKRSSLPDLAATHTNRWTKKGRENPALCCHPCRKTSAAGIVQIDTEIVCRTTNKHIEVFESYSLGYSKSDDSESKNVKSGSVNRTNSVQTCPQFGAHRRNGLIFRQDHRHKRGTVNHTGPQSIISGAGTNSSAAASSTLPCSHCSISACSMAATLRLSCRSGLSFGSGLCILAMIG